MEQIEVRSEKVRNFIGDIPPLYVRLGTLLVSGLFVLFILLAYNVRYPFIIEADGIIKKGKTVEVLVPYSRHSFVTEGLSANMIVEGWPDNIIHSVVAHVDDKVVIKDDGNYFFVYMKSSDVKSFSPSFQENLRVHVTLLVSNNTFLDYIFK